MTMKTNTELNTMMFFDDALESERTYLLTELADAVSETRTAADQAAQLSEDGEAGLLRLTEIWCAMNGVPAVIIFEGSQSELLANVVAQIYAHLLQHPFHDPVGLAVYVELRYMTGACALQTRNGLTRRWRSPSARRTRPPPKRIRRRPKSQKSRYGKRRWTRRPAK